MQKLFATPPAQNESKKNDKKFEETPNKSETKTYSELYDIIAEHYLNQNFDYQFNVSGISKKIFTRENGLDDEEYFTSVKEVEEEIREIQDIMDEGPSPFTGKDPREDETLIHLIKIYNDVLMFYRRYSDGRNSITIQQIIGILEQVAKDDWEKTQSAVATDRFNWMVLRSAFKNKNLKKKVLIDLVKKEKNTRTLKAHISNFLVFKNIRNDQNDWEAHIESADPEKELRRVKNSMLEVLNNSPEKLDNEVTELEIVKEWVKDCVEEDDLFGENISEALIFKGWSELPSILTKFGYVYDTYSSELDQIVNKAYKEIDEEDLYETKLTPLKEAYEEKFKFKGAQAGKSRPNTRISSATKREVWRRDEGKCVKCGSRYNLEYDHIIPVSKGGSNTARNVELLCQDCNRKKSDEIM